MGIIAVAALFVGGLLLVRNFVPGANPTVTVTLLYSTEKEDWLKSMVPQFEASSFGRVNGHPIKVEMKKLGSREVYLSVLNGEEKPDIISPASMLQIAILEDESRKKFGTPLVTVADRNLCKPVVSTPLVFVGWRERVDTLWPSGPGPDAWKKLQTAMMDQRGWSAFGKPEWGYLKFSHTNPLLSNSGFQAIVLMAYDQTRKTSGLSSADILANKDFQTWFQGMEGNITQFGSSTGDMMKEMVTYGPSRFDMLALYESVAIEQATNAKNRYGDLRVYYPPATLVSDHPFCVLNASWVNTEHRDAAISFTNYLLGRPAQEAALLNHGFRPTSREVPLDQAGSPFIKFADLGLKIGLPPEVQLPPGDVLSTLLDFWTRTTKN